MDEQLAIYKHAYTYQKSIYQMVMTFLYLFKLYTLD